MGVVSLITGSEQIRRIRPEEWQHYKAVRLRALKDSPDAFGSTYEASVKIPDPDWIKRIENASPDHDLPLIAWQGSEPKGLAWGHVENRVERVAHLYQMWVAPEVRGTGMGRRLLHNVLEWARAHQMNAMRLEVTVGNEPAEQLYLSMGFEVTGKAVPLRPGSELLEHSMILHLNE